VLISINERIKNLLGDSVILAATICYYGIFDFEKRIQLWSELAS